MAVTIHYAFYPHIFSTILEELLSETDRETQHALRLVCKSVKQAVDAQLCRSLHMFFLSANARAIGSPADYDLFLTALDRDLNRIPLPPPSFYSSWSPRKPLRLNVALRGDLAHALSAAHDLTVSLQDLIRNHTWTEQDAAYCSPFSHIKSVELLHLLHDGPGCEHGTLDTVPIPLTPRKLEVRVRSRTTWCLANIQHCCTELGIVDDDKVSLDDGEGVDRYCPFAVAMLNPCVRYLTLDVRDRFVAAAYLAAIKHCERHPALEITVNVQDSLDERALPTLERKWRELVDVTIHFRMAAQSPL